MICRIFVHVVLIILASIILFKGLVETNIISGFMGIKPGGNEWEQIIKRIEAVELMKTNNGSTVAAVHQIKSILANVLLSPAVTSSLILYMLLLLFTCCNAIV